MFGKNSKMEGLHKKIQDLFREFKEKEDHKTLLLRDKNQLEQNRALFGTGQNGQEELEHFNDIDDKVRIISQKLDDLKAGQSEKLEKIRVRSIELFGDVRQSDRNLLVSYKGESYKVSVDNNLLSISRLNG